MSFPLVRCELNLTPSAQAIAIKAMPPAVFDQEQSSLLKTIRD